MKVLVYITLKNTVTDSIGLGTMHSLHSSGYDIVKSVNVGKIIELDMAGDDKQKITLQIDQMCDKLLINKTIEEYEIIFP